MSQTIDVKRYEELARQKQGEHRKFLAQLKKKAPKNLDKIVQQVHNEVFQEIDCTQCANCCKTLGPDFTEQDITRIAKHFRMKLPAFEEMYLQVDEDGDKVFKSMPCPFLGPDNLCDIYDVRPKACAAFPHTDRKKIYQINHLFLLLTLQSKKMLPEPPAALYAFCCINNLMFCNIVVTYLLAECKYFC